MVFIFLQGWRATLIPLLAVPVSLVGTFAVFPLLGFSINTLSLFGLVLAIGLVVDDAIVVVEAVEHHIEQGLSPRDATLKAMEEVSGPVVAIALILVGGLRPDGVHPGHHRPAVPAVRGDHRGVGDHLGLQRADAEPGAGGPAAAAAQADARAARGVLPLVQPVVRPRHRRLRARSGVLIRKAALTMSCLVAHGRLAGFFGSKLPPGFMPKEDQGYLYMNVQLPAGVLAAAHGRRSCEQIDAILKDTPGVKYYTGVVGFSLLSRSFTTYNAFYFVTLEPWDERVPEGPQRRVIKPQISTTRSPVCPRRRPSRFPPPRHPRRGHRGRRDFRARGPRGQGRRVPRREDAAASWRRRASGRSSLVIDDAAARACRSSSPTSTATRCSSRASSLSDVYQTLQAFMGGSFVNYFNRFGRVWQVYVQAEGEYRTRGRERRPVLRAQRRRAIRCRCRPS